MKATTTDQPKNQQAKPLPPSKPDYIITSPPMLPPPYPKPPKRQTETKQER